MPNRYVAAAVAVALGHATLVNAAATCTNCPGATTAAAATHQIYVAGSSAAAAGFLGFVQNQICGSNPSSQFVTNTTAVGNPDFRAVSCQASSSSPAFPSDTVTVYYRPEGGSVVGMLPLLNNKPLKEINLNTASCSSTSTATNTAAYTCSGITGSAPANGTNDSFGGSVSSVTIDIGVTDVEPAVFGNTSSGTTRAYAGAGKHDPIASGAYSTATFGSDPSVSSIQNNLSPTIAFQQVFGFIVNSSLGIKDLPKEAIAAIYDGQVFDWHKITTSGNTAVTSSPTEIIICNREIGSGTRATTDIFLNGTGCNYDGGVNSLKDEAGVTPPGFSTAEPADNFQTIAELDCVNSHPNSIGYVSIDNFSKVSGGSASTSFPSAVAITVSGVAASVTNAAEGVYSDVFEAAIIESPQVSADGDTFYQAAAPALQEYNTTSNSAQVVAIPSAGSSDNAGTTPLQYSTGNKVYTSDFTRGGNSCSPLVFTHS